MVEAGRAAVRARPCGTTLICIWSQSFRAIPTSTAGSLCRPTRLAVSQALETCFEASPDRVHVFDVENHEGTPVYVHAKACVIDDVWACVGSDNLNRRSWTHDSELSCAVLDSEGEFARDLRLRLLREHLDRADDGSEDGGLADPVRLWMKSSTRQRRWMTGTHRAGRGQAPGSTAPAQSREVELVHAAVGRTRVPVDLRPGRTVLARPDQGRVVNSIGRLTGPLMPVIDFHGTGPAKHA